ncbi:MAG: MarR family winged helix-turn-helix transcriptional regulator [Nitrososphaerota archaeon]
MGTSESTEPALDPQQVRAVYDFMMFLGETLSRSARFFEEETTSSPAEVEVLRVLAQRGPLVVKEIARSIPGLSLSKLTRVLDKLESEQRITRTLNLQDRRSFLVAPTEQGLALIGGLLQSLNFIAQSMLTALTPTERLMLVELFAKIHASGQVAAVPFGGAEPSE